MCQILHNNKPNPNTQGVSRNTPLRCISLFILFCIISLMFPISSHAVVQCDLQTDPPSPVTVNTSLLNLLGHVDSMTYKFNLKNLKEEFQNLPLGGKFYVEFLNRQCGNKETNISINSTTKINSYTSQPWVEMLKLNYIEDLTKCYKVLQADPDPHQVRLKYGVKNNAGTLSYYDICHVSEYIIRRATDAPPTCKVDVNYTSGIGDIDSKWQITLTDTYLAKGYESWAVEVQGNKTYALPDGKSPITKIIDPPLEGGKTYYVEAKPYYYERFLDQDKYGKPCDTTSFTVNPRGTPAPPTPTLDPICPECYRYGCSIGDSCNKCPGCPGYTKPKPQRPAELKPLCEQISEPYQSLCKVCHNKNGYIWTAIGCLPTDFSALLKDYIFTYGVGIAAGTAFLYLLYGIFLLLTCGGNAEQIEQAKQTIVSALSGLLLIIFSVFLLKIIGVDILHLPDFG